MRSAIVAEARSLLGTPFHHQGRLPGVGIDCVGVLIVVARRLGLVPPDFDVTGYTREADGVSLMARLRDHVVPVMRPQAGDIGVYSWGQHPHHVGILVPYRDDFAIVHALSQSPAMVKETRLLPHMRQRGVFAFPGVA